MQAIDQQRSTPEAKPKWAALGAALLVAAAEALAQEKQINRTELIAEGREQPVRRIIVSIPDRRLALVEDDRVMKIYPVAVGAMLSPSPAGEFKIAHRIPWPTYYAPGIVIPPGKANPLGTRWLGLTEKGYGIHGTNQPRLIGRRASHGCIRMRNRDIEELFELVQVGDVVELHAERSAELAQIFGALHASTPIRSERAPVVAAAPDGPMASGASGR